MNFIRRFATEAPRTFAITVGWALFGAGFLTWITITDGIWRALMTLAIAVGVTWLLYRLSRWAEKGDGIDTKVVIRIDGDDVPVSESQLRAYQAWLERGGDR